LPGQNARALRDALEEARGARLQAARRAAKCGHNADEEFR
jgi:hypothetical protein